MENKVILIDYMGSDKLHSLAAWASTFAELDIPMPNNINLRVDELINHILNNGKKKKSIEELLDFLAKNQHESPFRFSSFVFAMTTDIATHIQKLKHTVILEAENGECLTGDNLITFVNSTNNAVRDKISVEKLYNMWENGRSHQQTEKDKLFCRRLINKKHLRVLNTKTGVFQKSNIKDIWYKGEQEVYEIKLENNKTIKCTTNHKIYTKKGFYTISEGLKVGDFVGVNGVSINVENKPYTFESFYKDASNYTRKEFAKTHNLKYELIKKWGYIFKVEFKEDENKNFKKGIISWNTGKAGTYKIDIKDRKHNPLKGDKSNFWKGGTSSERQKITAWTTLQSKIVHKKYNYTCQSCGEGNSVLHCHHIIPVSTDLEKSYNVDNLITLCQKCHSTIHKSIKSEMEFAKKILNGDYNILDKNWGKHIKLPKKRVDYSHSNKKVHFSKIISIEKIGVEKTYDIEVEGDHNNFVANGIVVHNSGRYKELKEDKFYIPKDWGTHTETNADILNKYNVYDWATLLQQKSQEMNYLYHECLKDLTPVLGRARAKESARFFKTYNSQINTFNKFSFDGVLQFYRKRSSSHAQLEIQDVANQMIQCIKNIEGNPFEYSLKAFL